MGGKDHRKGEAEEPDIEGVGRKAHEFALEFVRRVADDPGQKAGQDQDREHFQGDARHIGPETQVGRGTDHRDDHRDQEGGGHIHEDQVGHRAGQVPVQFPGDDPRGRGGGTDQAQHGAFREDPGRTVAQDGREGGESQEGENLEKQGPEVPAVQFQVMRRHLHELEEQQQGDDQALPFGRDGVEGASPGFQDRSEIVEKVQGDARDDGEGQHPVLEKLYRLIHGAAV